MDNADEIAKKLIAKNLSIAKEKGLSNIQFNIFGALLEKEDMFKSIGFNFKENLTMYKKDL